MLYNNLKILLLTFFALCFGVSGAQQLAIKTNILSDAFLSPNVAVEAPIDSHWSLDISGQLNAWTLSGDKRWKHWLVQPEARYWLCDVWDGHFFGAHLLGGQYNFGNINLPDFLGTHFSRLKDYRRQGWYVGAGVAYGYNWMLGKNWNLEAEIGFGWAYTRYDEFKCKSCGNKLKSNHPHNYVGPTKAAISIIYIFN